MASYDVVIIGGGPGGYNAAIRAGQLGMKVACVEKRATLGGTCLNVGCIPSKALLHASELYEMAVKDFAGFGIDASVKLNLPAMMKQKDDAVTALTKGVEFLFRKNKVDWIKGARRDRRRGQGRGHRRRRRAKRRSRPRRSSSPPAPSPRRCPASRSTSSASSIPPARSSLPEVPKTLIVIGAGIIGLELGSVWRRLGAEVTVVEFLRPHHAGHGRGDRQDLPALADQAGDRLQAGRPRSPAPRRATRASSSPSSRSPAAQPKR